MIRTAVIIGIRNFAALAMGTMLILAVVFKMGSYGAMDARAENSAALAQAALSGDTARKLNLRLVAAELKTVQSPIIGTGTIFAQKTSKIGPLVEGPVVRIHVNVGDHVKKDEPLFEIRPDNYRFIFNEYKALLSEAEARVRDAEPAFERAQKLMERKNISQARLDKAHSALALVRAKIEFAKVRTERAKKDLEDTLVHAPFDGVVTFRYVDEGVYLSNRVPGGNSAVIELQKIDIVTAIIQVPSRELEKLYVGAPVKLVIDGISNPVEAKITIINDKVDVATRTVEVRIVIKNSGYAIKPGLFIRAEILPKSRKALIIPRHAVQGPRGSRYVFVLSDGKAARMNVRTVDHDATHVEIISGLTGTKRVLSGPDLPGLIDGLVVGEVPDVAG